MSFFRHPKTTAERRAAEACPVPIRAKRNPVNLPNSYTDVNFARTGRNDRYKNHRRS